MVQIIHVHPALLPFIPCSYNFLFSHLTIYPLGPGLPLHIILSTYLCAFRPAGLWLKWTKLGSARESAAYCIEFPSPFIGMNPVNVEWWPENQGPRLLWTWLGHQAAKSHQVAAWTPLWKQVTTQVPQWGKSKGSDSAVEESEGSLEAHSSAPF